jgi:hypothetical protein
LGSKGRGNDAFIASLFGKATQPIEQAWRIIRALLVVGLTCGLRLLRRFPTRFTGESLFCCTRLAALDFGANEKAVTIFDWHWFLAYVGGYLPLS